MIQFCWRKSKKDGLVECKEQRLWSHMALGRDTALLLARYVTLSKFPNFSSCLHLSTWQSCCKIMHYICPYGGTMTGAESEVYVQSRCGLFNKYQE